MLSAVPTEMDQYLVEASAQAPMLLSLVLMELARLLPSPIPRLCEEKNDPSINSKTNYLYQALPPPVQRQLSLLLVSLTNTVSTKLNLIPFIGYQKDGNNAYPAYDNTVYESSTTYTFSESSSTSSSSSTGSSTSMPPITDVVLSTQIVTITSCHPTVTNCPASMATYTSLSQSVVTITAVIVSDTTYCPEAEATPTPPSYVNVPIAVQPPPSPSPEAPSPSPEAAEIPMSPEAPEQTETPVSSGCPGGCEVYEVVPTVYVIPTPFYAAGNTTSTSPTGAGSPSPSFNANGASTNEIGVLAAAAGLVLAALF